MMVMHAFIKSFHKMFVLVTLSAVTLLGAGCATNGRYVLLKEYGPSIPPQADSPLKGKIICIEGFQCAASLISPDPQMPPEQPPQFTFVEYTPEQSQTWDQEFRALKKNADKNNLRVIGKVRNGFGMVMSQVYALNDPGAWLAETLKMDLESRGAKVVGPSESDSADIGVSGTVQFCRVDIYMKIWGDLAVNLELQPKNHNATNVLLHTSGGTVAWVGATSEFYKPLRESRQKFSWLASREIIKALGQ